MISLILFVKLDELVARLDRYFHVPEVQSDGWSPEFDDCYPDSYWRDYVESEYPTRWNGLMVRGARRRRRRRRPARAIARARVCVIRDGECGATTSAPFFGPKFDAFREQAGEREVALVDRTHYGTEKPPQLAMVEWFQRFGMRAQFQPDGPKLDG
jgi:hypothetical protein